MFGIDDAILGGVLSFGGKLLSGLGASRSAKKQQQAADQRTLAANRINQVLQEDKNIIDRDYGLAFIRQADALPSFDIAAFKRDFGDETFNMSDFMAAGRAAGFNPVTWLNSGMAAYFDTRAYASFYDNRAERTALRDRGIQMISPGITPWQAGETVAIPSTLSAIGGAVSAGAETWSAATASANRLTAQQAGMNALLSAVQKGRASGNALSGVGTPAFSTAGSLVTGGGAAAALSLGRNTGLQQKQAEAEDPAQWQLGLPKFEAGENKITNPELMTQTKVDTAFSDSQVVEDRYGDVIEALYGITVLGADMYRGLTGRQLGGDLAADWSLIRRDYASGGLGADRRQAAWEVRPQPGWQFPSRGWSEYFNVNPGDLPNYGNPSP